MKTFFMEFAIVALLVSCLSAVGCKEEQAKPTLPRPVKVVTLRTLDPTVALRLTGVIEAWADQDVAFEVPGRVDFVLEEGTLVKGRWVEDGKVIAEGDILATIDKSTYAAAAEAAKAEAEYARVNLESVLPAQLKVAKANSEYRKFAYQRTLKVHEKSAATDVELAQERAMRDMSIAKVDEAKASIQAGRSSLAKAGAALVQANLDLENTTLRTPFNGQISKVHVRVGGYVRAGQAVAHLVTTDPVKVNVTVSAETNATVAVGDLVDIFRPRHDKPLLGRVYQKATVADPGTRTFKVTLITRNFRAPVNPPKDPAMAKLPRISGILRVLLLDPARTGALYVDESRCLRKDDEGYFVWALQDPAGGRKLDPSQPVHTVRKVRVTLGEDRFNLQGIYVLRELKDTGGLKALDALAADPPDSLKDGDRVAHIPEDWVLQPDGIVQAQFRRDRGTPGFYVPMPAVTATDARTGGVFVVDTAAGKAKKVTVTLGEAVAGLQRIEGEGLAEGAAVIVEGAHYIKDGEPVSIVSTQED